jgi:N-acetylglucosamine transport system substrate-binding protein
MSSESKSINRRTVLRGAAATAALVPLAGVVAACAGGGAGETSSSSESQSSSSSESSSESSEAPTSSGSSSESSAPAGGANPFGLESGSTVNAVIFNGGYGYDYVQFAADVAAKQNDGVTFDVKPSTKIATELQPQFVGGNPPDLIDNSGADAIGFSTILEQLSTLDDVFD